MTQSHKAENWCLSQTCETHTRPVEHRATMYSCNRSWQQRYPNWITKGRCEGSECSHRRENVFTKLHVKISKIQISDTLYGRTESESPGGRSLQYDHYMWRRQSVCNNVYLTRPGPKSRRIEIALFRLDETCKVQVPLNKESVNAWNMEIDIIVQINYMVRHGGSECPCRWNIHECTKSEI